MEKKKLGNFCMIGFPDDMGIGNVGGRLGAEQGPKSFLESFSRLKGRSDVQSRLTLSEWVEMGKDLDANHERSVDTVRKIRTERSSEILLVVGGGHDYAYPWIRGVVESQSRKKKIGCLNIDAHFDLREYLPAMTSGSPFRRVIEENLISGANLVEFGIQRHCNGAPLFEYAKRRKIKVFPFEELRDGKAVSRFKAALKALSKVSDEVLLSVDLDAMAFAYCPGVSAPQGEGFTGSELFQMLEIAGADKKVTSLGIFELSPPLDVQNLTSRLAAQAAWHFLDVKLF